MSENFYQHLFNSLKTPIMLLDDSGKIIDANPALISLLSGQKEKIIGKAAEKLFAGIAPEDAIPLLLNSEKDTIEITWQQQETEKSYYLNSFTFPGKDGPVVNFIIFNEKTDNAELKNRVDSLEEDLQNEKRFSVFGHLTPGIVHNINNLLAVVIGRTQLMHIKYPDIPDVESIQERADLIKDLMDALSYKIGHESAGETAPINISDLFRNELAVLNADPFYKHMVQKQINLDGNIPTVRGYYKDFSAALLSVINFSLDSMLSSEQKSLSVTTRAESGYIIINIADTGAMAETKDQFPSSEKYQSPRMGKHIVNLQQARELLAIYNGTIDLIKNSPGAKEFLIKIPC